MKKYELIKEGKDTFIENSIRTRPLLQVGDE